MNRLILLTILLATTLVPASWAGVICTLNVGGQPSVALHDAVNNRTFVTLSSGNEILVLGHGCVIERTLSASGSPEGIAFDGTNLWVALTGANLVEKINVTTGSAATYPVGTGPRGVAFDGTYIWVTNSGSNNVTKLLATTGAHIATIPVGSFPWGVAVNAINGPVTIWVANEKSASISILEQNGALKQTLATGSEPTFFASSTLYNGGNWAGEMVVNCYTAQLVETFFYDGVLPAKLVASSAISGNPVFTSPGSAGVFGVTHNGHVFLIGSDGGVRYESLGSNNYGVAVDFNNSSVWVTDINEGLIFEIVF